jgi:hypothetical protein
VKYLLALLLLAVALVVAWRADAQVIIYDNSPRIIVVPQGRAYGAVRNAPVIVDEDYEVEPGLERIDPPKSRKPAKSFAPRIRADQPPRNEPKRSTLTPLPPAPEPKRAVLNAPPAPPEGPSPIKPTPRWRNADRIAPPVVTDNTSAPLPEIDSSPHAAD